MSKAMKFTTDLGDGVQVYDDGWARLKAGGATMALSEFEVDVLREFFEWEKAREEERMNPAFEQGEVWRITYDDGTEIVANIDIAPTGHVYLVNDYLNVYFGIGTRDKPRDRDGIVNYERISA